MIRKTKLEITNEKKELRQELFDLKHPRNERGKFIHSANPEDILIYWRKRWGEKYGIGQSEERQEE